MLRTASHEITHWIQDSDTKLYEQLHEYVLQTFIKERGQENYIDNLKSLWDDYKQENSARTRRDIEEEFVAFACEMMLEHTKAFEDLAMRNRTLAQKLSEGLQRFIEKVKELLHHFIGEGKDNLQKGFEGVKAEHEISKFFASSVERMNTLQKLWDHALIEAVEGKSTASVKLEGIQAFETLTKDKKLGAVKAKLSSLQGRVPISGTLTQVECLDSGEYGKNLKGELVQISPGKYTEVRDSKGVVEFELGSTKYTKLYYTEEEFRRMGEKRANEEREKGEISLKEAENSVKTFFRCSVPVQIEGKNYVADVIVGFPYMRYYWDDSGERRTVIYGKEVENILQERDKWNVLVDPTDYNMFYDFVLYDVLEIKEKIK